MNKLQSITYNLEELINAEEMYIRGTNYHINRKDKFVIVYKHGRINYCTYFNEFSVEKWNKYTTLKSLILRIKAQGNFSVRIINKWLTAGDYLEKCICEMEYNFACTEIAEIDLSDFLNEKGIIYFQITAHTDTYIFDCNYCTFDNFNTKKLALAICTYKREDYIKKLIKNYEAYDQKDQIGIFIADNGMSLDIKNNNNIHIFKNKNAGGAAGFSRCMLEITKYNKKYHDEYDYIVLMDDDVIVDFNVFEKLVSFISLLKSRYSTYFIAGAMCSLDYPYLQYEKYSSWRGDYFVQFGGNENLNNVESIVRNEREEHFKYQIAGWWFCCFALKIINDNNYPFPCFFRGDDMEFSIRNGGNIISLNGICVWHEPFYKKYSIVSEYYYLVRNTLVINALYINNITYKQAGKYLLSKIKFNLLKYDYAAAELVIKAAEDFLKGTCFFAETDAEIYNQDLSVYNHKMIKLEELCEEYKYSDIEYECYLRNDKSRLSMMLRRLTINGFFIPAFFYKPLGFSLTGFGAKNINFYKKSKVLNFDPFIRKGYILQVSKKRAIKIMFQYLKLYIALRKKYESARQDYQINAHRLNTKSFWEKYLGVV